MNFFKWLWSGFKHATSLLASDPGEAVYSPMFVVKSYQQLVNASPVAVKVTEDMLSGDRWSITHCPGARVCNSVLQQLGMSCVWAFNWGYASSVAENLKVLSYSDPEMSIPIDMTKIEEPTTVYLKFT